MFPPHPPDRSVIWGWGAGGYSSIRGGTDDSFAQRRKIEGSLQHREKVAPLQVCDQGFAHTGLRGGERRHFAYVRPWNRGRGHEDRA